MTVAEVSDLRRKMRDAGASYKVTKNRLTRLALEGTKYEALKELLTGPTAVAVSVDPVAAAKVCVTFAKANEKLIIVGAAMGETTMDPSPSPALATLPSPHPSRGKQTGTV